MSSLRGPGRFTGVGVVAVLVSAVLVSAGLTACSSGPSPDTTASAYLSAWSKQDWAAMRQLVDKPPADFTSVNTAAFTDLHVSKATLTAGTMKTTGSAASEPVTERLELSGIGSITI